MRSGMRLGASVFCLLMFLSAPPAECQLIITMHDVQQAIGIGKASVSSKTPDGEMVSVFIGKPSMTPQEWDFSSLHFAQFATSEYVSVMEAPFSSLFQDANIVRKTEEPGPSDPMYQYFRLTGESFSLLGTCFESDTGAKVFSPAVCQIRFPCAFATSWSYEGEPEHPMEGVTMITRQYCVVDAKGTMKLAIGEYPAIRLRREIIIDVTTPAGSSLNRHYSFTWLSAEMITVSLVMDTTQEANTTINTTDVVLEIPTQPSPVERIGGAATGGISLGEPYPNPARRHGFATVHFDLPAPREVTLDIHDALGRRIAVLVDGRLDAGRYSERWNTERVPAGVYFVTLQATDSRLTKKILVLE